MQRCGICMRKIYKTFNTVIKLYNMSLISPLISKQEFFMKNCMFNQFLFIYKFYDHYFIALEWCHYQTAANRGTANRVYYEIHYETFRITQFLRQLNNPHGLRIFFKYNYQHFWLLRWPLKPQQLVYRAKRNQHLHMLPLYYKILLDTIHKSSSTYTTKAPHHKKHSTFSAYKQELSIVSDNL